VKKLFFWTVVIVGILAAVAVLMKRRSDLEDVSWQGYLEDSKDTVSKAVNAVTSGPDAAEQAKDAVDAAAEGTKDVVDLTADTSKDVAEKAKDVAAKAKH
jgi:hypothetical protein